MDYRRVFVPGGTYFFTLVTFNRRPIFADPNAVELLREAFRYTMERMPLTIVASVIMPDHIHFVWTLPNNDIKYPTRWRLIKSYFSRKWSSKLDISINPSRKRKGEKEVWQRRYWEHLIRNENDLEKHVEYIHFNPVKHEYVSSPSEWKYSSFNQFVSLGLYPEDWMADTDKFSTIRGAE